MAAGGEVEENDPAYSEVGNYLLQTESLHDCHFLVGKNKERIGAVKFALINQSRVWWSMLSPDSPLRETSDVSLPDIEPDIFKLLLKHCYGGLENVSSLSVDTLMKLCYCADKYHMKALLKKLEEPLRPSSVDQLFPALHCLVYFKLQGVEQAVQEIVQTKTNAIFKHPEFLELDVDCVTYIAKQDRLSCDELKLWKAVVAWAKHKAGSGGSSCLREWIKGPLQHIRLLTVDRNSFYDDVVFDNILNNEEIINICKRDVKTNETLCQKTDVRGLFVEVFPKIVVDIQHDSTKTNNSYKSSTSKSCSCITVGNRNIIINSISCIQTDSLSHWGTNSEVNIVVTISRLANPNVNEFNEQVVITHNNFETCVSELFTFPTAVSGDGVLLKANSKYMIKLEFGDCNISCWRESHCIKGHDFQHGTFFCSWDYFEGKGQTPCHIRQFTYSVPSE